MQNINNSLYTNIIRLRNCNQKFKVPTNIYYSRLTIYILNIFYNEGYIQGYMFINIHEIKVFFKYYLNNGLLKYIRFGLNTKIIFSAKALQYLYYGPYFTYVNSNFCLFTTPYGFSTLRQIFDRNIKTGGILYFYIIPL